MKDYELIQKTAFFIGFIRSAIKGKRYENALKSLNDYEYWFEHKYIYTNGEKTQSIIN